MARLQYKLRTLILAMTLVAVACVVVPAAPSVFSRFMADTRHMLVAAALAMFVTTVICYRTSRRVDRNKSDSLTLLP